MNLRALFVFILVFVITSCGGSSSDKGNAEVLEPLAIDRNQGNITLLWDYKIEECVRAYSFKISYIPLEELGTNNWSFMDEVINPWAKADIGTWKKSKLEFAVSHLGPGEYVFAIQTGAQDSCASDFDPKSKRVDSYSKRHISLDKDAVPSRGWYLRIEPKLEPAQKSINFIFI